MTNQKLHRLQPDQTRSCWRVGLIASAAASLVVGTLLAGCGEEEEEKVQEVAKSTQLPPPPPPPPPPPSVTPVADLMTQYNIDSRVNLQESDAPDTDEQRIAVLLFFDAFARGDAARAGDFLSAPDRTQLERMTKSDEWDEVTGNIFAIDVRTGMSPTGDDVALGVFMVGENFQPTLWTYQVTGDPSLGQATFDAEPTPPNLINRLSGDDWIQAWYMIWGQELARASEMDEEIEIPSQDFTEEEDSNSGGMGSPSQGPGGGGGAPGKRKRDPGKKVNPNPGFGPGGN